MTSIVLAVVGWVACVILTVAFVRGASDGGAVPDDVPAPASTDTSDPPGTNPTDQ